MMKKIILSLAIASSGYCSYAQNIFPSTGNVGVGTTSPAYPLTLNNTSETGILTVYNGTSVFLSHGGWYMGAGKFGIGNGTTPTLVVNTIANGGTSVGNVGIGTTNPIAPFHVYTNTNVYGIITGDGINSNLRISGTAGGATGYSLLQTFNNGTTAGGTLCLQRDAGNVGIGTTSPVSRLDVEGSASTEWVSIKSNAGGTAGNIDIYSSGTGGFNAGTVGLNTQGTLALNVANVEALRIVNGGNVLIGRTSQVSQTYKLDVNGSARANEIVVNTTGADFVFDKKYSLPKLSYIKSYIDENHHLPEIPSAKEMQTNGVELGQLNTKLLQKVEELTLYLIDKDKQDKKKDEELAMQRKQIDEQEARIVRLEKMLKVTEKHSK